MIDADENPAAAELETRILDASARVRAEGALECCNKLLSRLAVKPPKGKMVKMGDVDVWDPIEPVSGYEPDDPDVMRADRFLASYNEFGVDASGARVVWGAVVAHVCGHEQQRDDALGVLHQARARLLRVRTAAAPEAMSCSHSQSFSSVTWFGRAFDFTQRQSQIVEALWHAWETGNPRLTEDAIVETITGEDEDPPKHFRIRDTFRKKETRPGKMKPRHVPHEAMEYMIFSPSKGIWALGRPPRKEQVS